MEYSRNMLYVVLDRVERLRSQLIHRRVKCNDLRIEDRT